MQLPKAVEIERFDGLKVEDVRPLRDRVAGTIRMLIIDGRLGPGERLREPDLAAKLGISRTPLREALLLLDSEGFITVHPRRGAVVSPLSLRDAIETYQVKGALESAAARLACASISEETVATLETINKEIALRGRGDTTDYSSILRLNALFHQTLSDAAGNAKLSQFIRLLRSQALRYNYIYLSVLSHLADSVAEHEAILGALRRKDPAAVEDLVKQHGEAACRALCVFIENHSSAQAQDRSAS